MSIPRDDRDGVPKTSTARADEAFQPAQRLEIAEAGRVVREELVEFHSVPRVVHPAPETEGRHDHDHKIWGQVELSKYPLSPISDSPAGNRAEISSLSTAVAANSL
jgi:hypothetical protein